MAKKKMKSSIHISTILVSAKKSETNHMTAFTPSGHYGSGHERNKVEINKVPYKTTILAVSCLSVTCSMCYLSQVAADTCLGGGF